MPQYEQGIAAYLKKIREEATAPETKPERSSIAAFFGFAPKPPPESEPADTKPARKGWWQRADDK